jgi:hypothetical protein
MHKTKLRNRALSLSVFVLIVSAVAFSQTPATAVDAKTVPVMDGGIGQCSADFSVTDNAGAPVYDAKIKVHIAYGFMYWRKLDLEQATNVDGKARFVGLPTRTKSGLFFQISQGDRTGDAFDDPDKTCKAQFTVVLQNKAQVH